MFQLLQQQFFYLFYEGFVFAMWECTVSGSKMCVMACRLSLMRILKLLSHSSPAPDSDDHNVLRGKSNACKAIDKNLPSMLQ